MSLFLMVIGYLMRSLRNMENDFLLLKNQINCVMLIISTIETKKDNTTQYIVESD